MAQAASAFRPQLETLEDRQLMATQISFDTSQTVMFLTGDKRSNTIILQDNGTGTLGNIAGTVDGKDISLITATRAIRSVVIDAGKGNDRVTFQLNPLNPGQVPANMAVVARLGDGHDTFAAALDNVSLDGAFYDFQVFGGKGNDTITASAMNTNLDQDMILNFYFVGEDGNDTLRLTADNSMEARARLNAFLLGDRGNDSVSISHNVQDFSFGRAHLRAYGGLGFDRLDLVSRVEPFADTLIDGEVDGGVPLDVGLQSAFYRQWEDITLTGNIRLANVDPRSRVTYIRA